MGRQESGDSVGGQILNMFNMDSRLWTVGRQPHKGASVLESTNSELESTDSSNNCNADPPKVSVWVWPFTLSETNAVPYILLFCQFYSHICLNFRS